MKETRLLSRKIYFPNYACQIHCYHNRQFRLIQAKGTKEHWSALPNSHSYKSGMLGFDPCLHFCCLFDDYFLVQPQLAIQWLFASHFLQLTFLCYIISYVAIPPHRQDKKLDVLLYLRQQNLSHISKFLNVL